jgi:hypothetical protein
VAEYRDKLGRKIPAEAFDNDHPPTTPVDKKLGSLYDFGKKLIKDAKKSDATRADETEQRDSGS